MSEPDVRQVLVHPVVWPHLELWLAGRGLVLARVPVEDDLPTYAMTLADPGDAEKVIRAARQAAKTCRCPHPTDEHSVYGCADDCACEWMPQRGAARQAAGQPSLPRRDATVDPAVCPRCKGDNQDAFELCATCAAAAPSCTCIHPPEEDAGHLLHASYCTAAVEETHIVADDSDDPEHVDDCPGCEPAAGQPDTQQQAEPAPVVAYRDPRNPRVLLCRDHGRKWHGVVPLTADDLPDGGICVFGRLSSFECGRDVLADEAARQHDRKAGR